jgi:regulator of replication initiation timing
MEIDLSNQQQPEQPSPIMQQIGVLTIRINDMMTQLNTVMKTLIDENAYLKRENSDLKTNQEKTSKS